jgi:hypothetical protein
VNGQTSLIQDVACDPLWLADRYDPDHDAIHFRHVNRDQHRAATFLTAEYLGEEPNPVVIRRQEACAAAAATQGPVHFIFHSAYCCSTLLARAFDIPGVSMGLKEPTILNDLVGWRHRGAPSSAIAPVLDDSLALLSRRFGAHEAVIVKPSNVCNGLTEAMMALRPNARALLLYAPLKLFLGSVAKKGMWGRLWVRDLMVKQLKEGFIDLGLSDEDYLGLTDLQAAAVGWLAQQALFGRMANHLGNTRILMLDSESVLAAPLKTIKKLSELFQLELSNEALKNITSGSVFSRHSKFDNNFDTGTRKHEQKEAATIHGDEIDMVVQWTEVIATNNDIPLTLNQ